MTARLVFSYYDLLGVSQTASADEIVDAEAALRRVYRARTDAEATEMLQRLAKARAVLLDERQRAAYDRDPAVLARSYVDVAYPLPIGRHAKLEQLAAWLGEPGGAPLRLADWAAPDPLLDGDS